MIKTSLSTILPYLLLYLFLGAVYFGHVFRQYREVRSIVNQDALSMLIMGLVTCLTWPFLLGGELGEWFSDKLVGSR